MPPRQSVLLIFGTSHVGKSTLAARVGRALGWQVQSTDSLARHPGRPWPEVREPVAEFYSRLTDESVFWFLRVHHENMQPLLRQRIVADCQAGKGSVLEGSALRPEFINTLDRPEVLAVGFTQRDQFSGGTFHERAERLGSPGSSTPGLPRIAVFLASSGTRRSGYSIGCGNQYHRNASDREPAVQHEASAKKSRPGACWPCRAREPLRIGLSARLRI